MINSNKNLTLRDLNSDSLKKRRDDKNISLIINNYENSININYIHFGDKFKKVIKQFKNDDDEFIKNKDMDNTINGIKDWNNEVINLYKNDKVSTFSNLNSFFDGILKIFLKIEKNRIKLFLFENKNLLDFEFIKKFNNIKIMFDENFTVTCKKSINFFNYLRCFNNESKYIIKYDNKYKKNNLIGFIKYLNKYNIQKYYIYDNNNVQIFCIIKILDKFNNIYFNLIDNCDKYTKVYNNKTLDFIFRSEYSWKSKILIIFSLYFIFSKI